jgi:hypothetical protein
VERVGIRHPVHRLVQAQVDRVRHVDHADGVDAGAVEGDDRGEERVDGRGQAAREEGVHAGAQQQVDRGPVTAPDGSVGAQVRNGLLIERAETVQVERQEQRPERGVVRQPEAEPVRRVQVPPEGQQPGAVGDRVAGAEVTADRHQVRATGRGRDPQLGAYACLELRGEVAEPVSSAEPHIGEPRQVPEQREGLDVVPDVLGTSRAVRLAIVENPQPHGVRWTWRDVGRVGPCAHVGKSAALGPREVAGPSTLCLVDQSAGELSMAGDQEATGHRPQVGGGKGGGRRPDGHGGVDRLRRAGAQTLLDLLERVRPGHCRGSVEERSDRRAQTGEGDRRHGVGGTTRA